MPGGCGLRFTAPGTLSGYPGDPVRRGGHPGRFGLDQGRRYGRQLGGPLLGDAFKGGSLPELMPDIVFAGENEAAIAVGPADDAKDLARRLAALGPSQAVIKLGADDAVALVDVELFRQPAVPVDSIDAVGAGDAFVAGYLAEFIAELDPAERLRSGAATALSPVRRSV